MEKIVILGGGGHARVIFDALKLQRQFEIVGYVDPKDQGLLCGELPYIGGDDILGKLFYKNVKSCVCAIGSIGDTKCRRNVIACANNLGYQFPIVVHPSAVISYSATIGKGVFVSALAVINPGVSIGDFSIVNTGSIIEHDCIVGEFCHIAPRACLGGGVALGENVHVGIGASILQTVKIGSDCIIGAGSVVVKNIDKNQKVKGIPARA
jgi:sugar O-acyltransferase (sialic acid O-acetyltransferase NeuD family)